MTPVISTRDLSEATPTGLLFWWVGTADEIPAGCMVADGRRLTVENYAELFEVIGPAYAPPTIPRPGLFWEVLRRHFGLKLHMRNPDYVPGTFRIPDARGQYMRPPS